MEKINKTIKLKFLGILLMSNLSIYLLTNSEIEESSQLINQSPQIRTGYVKLNIQAKLNTPYKSSEIVMITDKRRSFLIRYAILLNKESKPSSDFQISDTSYEEKITIYLHKKNAALLLNKKDLQILPQISELQTLKRDKKRKYYDLSL